MIRRSVAASMFEPDRIDGDGLARELLAQREQAGETGRARALGEVVRRAQQHADRVGDLRLA